MNGEVHTPLLLSVIVPVHNNPQDLRQCLAALQAVSYPDSEIIVVDDASTDDSPAVALEMGARLLRLPINAGPAAARNYGASQASGDLLFFVDADVVVAPDAMRRVVELFAERSDLAAVFGSYDVRPRDQGVVSRYRNLLHHFVHQHGNPEASTFWSGCGAIRRAVFQALGGFDAKRFPRPTIEDIELGYRLRQAGHRILLDKGLQATHLKRWTLWSVIHTDVLCRAVPWSRLILERQNTPDDLNLKGAQRLSVALVGLACLCLPLALLRLALLVPAAIMLLAVVVLNRQLFAFFRRQHGLVFAAACVPLHLLHYWYSGLSYVYVWIDVRIKGATTHPPQPSLARGRPGRRGRTTVPPRSGDRIDSNAL